MSCVTVSGNKVHYCLIERPAAVVLCCALQHFVFFAAGRITDLFVAGEQAVRQCIINVPCSRTTRELHTDGAALMAPGTDIVVCEECAVKF